MADTRLTPAVEVAQTILNGSACAILVEGEEQASDAQILKTMFKRLGQAVTFHGRDGRDNLIRELPEFITRLPQDKAAAILDRDFMNDAEVEATYLPNYTGHIFYWRRYCIENYLLEPELIVNCIHTAHALNPDAIPETLKTVDAIEGFLLDWCRRVAPQVAGNWTIHELTQESDRQGLNIEAQHYFKDVTDRDSAWVLSQLTHRYGGWEDAYSSLFSANALRERFEDKLNEVSEKTTTLRDAHQIVDGKRFLKQALNRELPSGLKPYFFSLLAEAASKNLPEDLRLLVEDRILP
ncbi:MAG TPA: DUF4435 domain-containing protein, partial [Anaerolineales bacterium]|nr:DUF4435 domain-containing protein [Anaerolineales bacterium]